MTKYESYNAGEEQASLDARNAGMPFVVAIAKTFVRGDYAKGYCDEAIFLATLYEAHVAERLPVMP